VVEAQPADRGLPRGRWVVRETESGSGEPSNTAGKAVQPLAIAERPAAFVTHGTVPKFNGEVPRERQHSEVAWVLHRAPGLEAAVCTQWNFSPIRQRRAVSVSCTTKTSLDSTVGPCAIAPSFGVRAE